MNFFLLLNICVFFKTASPLPEKSHPPLPSNPPLKVEILSSPPSLKFGGQWLNPPPSRKGGAAYYGSNGRTIQNTDQDNTLGFQLYFNTFEVCWSKNMGMRYNHKNISSNFQQI